MEKTIAQQLNVTKFPFIIKDDKGNLIYFENSKGNWAKTEYDDKGNLIYFEDSDGYIMDKRPKSIPEYTMEELVIKLGHNFKIKK
jgi:hypothetical protein